MRLFLFILCTILLQTSFSQKNYRLGIGYSAGISSFFDNLNSSTDQLLNADYVYKFDQGATVKYEVDLSKRWDFIIQSGYQQRGVRFKGYIDAYDPRYRLNYWDVLIGGQILVKTIDTDNALFTSIGITQHTLISSKRVFDTGKEDINDEFSKIDLGASLGLGYKISVFQSDCIQLQVVANFGFKQLYTGTFYQNGMRAYNLLFNVQVHYLF